jgi:hypothetical protein
VLQILGGLTLLVALVSLVGLLPKWAIALPVLLIVGFLFIARRQVRLANETYWASVATMPEEGSAVVVRRTAVRVEASRPSDEDEPTVTLTSAERRQAAALEAEEEHVVAVSLKTAEGGSLWDPLPVTLPTYVGAPVVKRTFRTIDLGEPGTWSSGHSAIDSETVAAADAAPSAAPHVTAAADEDDTDEVAQAVNG